MTSLFWNHLDKLVESSEIVIDRPKRMKEPPVDYGYLSGTTGGDGDEIDVWRGSLEMAHMDAIVCTVDLGKRDAEVKVLLGCTKEEKQSICKFHASEDTAALLVERSTSSE